MTWRLHPRVILAATLAAVVLVAAATSGCGGSTTQAQGSGGSAAQSGSGAGGSPAAATATETRAPSPEPSRTKNPEATPTAAATAAADPTGGPASGEAPALRVVFVDVGQGDAAVLRSGAWTGLIDGGPSGSEAAVEAALGKLGVRRLDTLVISHLHADHTGGLPALVAEYRPRRAWVAGAVRGSLAAALRGAGTVVVQARRGLTWRFGKSTASVVAPGGLSGDANSDSIVLAVDAAGSR